VQIDGQIDDCRMLIEYFSGMSTTAMNDPVPLVETSESESDSEEEEDNFVGTKDRSEFKKGPKAHGTTVTGKMPSSPSIDLPFYTRSALISLSIPPPSRPRDVALVVWNLKTKKARLEEIARLKIAREEQIPREQIPIRQGEITREEITRSEEIVRRSEEIARLGIA
jgi:hypothetical protein